MTEKTHSREEARRSLLDKLERGESLTAQERRLVVEVVLEPSPTDVPGIIVCTDHGCH